MVSGRSRCRCRIPAASRARCATRSPMTTGGVHLVDPGWDTPDNLTRLEAALAVAGFGLGDVRSVTASHFHPDHLGLAARLRVSHGIPVAMHRAEHEALSRPLYPDAEATIARWGVPEDRLDEVHSVALPRSQPSGLAADVVLDDGDLLPIRGVPCGSSPPLGTPPDQSVCTTRPTGCSSAATTCCRSSTRGSGSGVSCPATTHSVQLLASICADGGLRRRGGVPRARVPVPGSRRAGRSDRRSPPPP